MNLKWIFVIISTIFVIHSLAHTHHAVETEMFAIPISPNLFNWTYQGKYYIKLKYRNCLSWKNNLTTNGNMKVKTSKLFNQNTLTNWVTT